MRVDIDQFIFNSMISFDNPYRKIQKSNGIEIDNENYWCDYFSLPCNIGEMVEVRFDPENVDRVFVWIEAKMKGGDEKRRNGLSVKE